MERAPGHDYRTDYALFGLRPGCTAAELRRARQRLSSALHPDRSGSDGRRLAELNAGYERLLEFQRRHGRLPGQAPVVLATGAGPAPCADRPRAGAASPRSGLRRALFGVALLATVAVLLLAGRTASTDGVATSDADPDARIDGPVVPAAPAEARPRAQLRLGDDAARVRELLGDPFLRSGNVWEYGPSHVRFEDGRVAGWHSSPLNPLPVAQARAGD